MFKAAIFDMDELLVDSGALWGEVETEIFSEVGIRLTEEMCAETVGLRIDGIVGHWYRKFPWQTPDPADVAQRIRSRIAHLARQRSRAMAGAEDAIRLLARRGIPLGLCSSSPMMVIEATLEGLRARGAFQTLHSADEEPLGKPHPGAYLSTAAKMGVAPRDCLAFEDSFVGSLAAKSAGMTVVAIPSAKDFGDPRFSFCDAVLPSLALFDERLLESLAAARN